MARMDDNGNLKGKPLLCLILQNIGSRHALLETMRISLFEIRIIFYMSLTKMSAKTDKNKEAKQLD